MTRIGNVINVTNKYVKGAPNSINSYEVCHTAGHYGEEYDD